MNDTPNNDRRFVYRYFNRNEPEKIGQAAAVRHMDAATNPGGAGQTPVSSMSPFCPAASGFSGVMITTCSLSEPARSMP